MIVGAQFRIGIHDGLHHGEDLWSIQGIIQIMGIGPHCQFVNGPIAMRRRQDNVGGWEMCVCVHDNMRETILIYFHSLQPYQTLETHT